MSFSKTIVNHITEYQNNSKTASEEIQKVILFIVGKRLNIKIIVQSVRLYNRLVDSIVSEGFEKPDIGNVALKELAFSTCDSGLIGNFIKTICCTATEFNEIKEEIAIYFGVDLTLQYIRPIWLKEGDFYDSFPPNGDLIREVTYFNSNSSHCLKQLQLLGYINGSFQIVMEVKTTAQHQELFKSIESRKFKHFVTVDDNEPKTIRLRFFSTEMSLIANYLDIICEKAPELFDILDGVVNPLKYSADQFLPCAHLQFDENFSVLYKQTQKNNVKNKPFLNDKINIDKNKENENNLSQLKIVRFKTQKVSKPRQL